MVDIPKSTEASMRSEASTRSGGKILKVLLAILLPPVGVLLEVGLGLHFWINIVLTLFGYVPGIIHAIYIILRK
jgi:uncharacterized membrane protein YqaE (UPF0057 family)